MCMDFANHGIGNAAFSKSANNKLIFKLRCNNFLKKVVQIIVLSLFDKF